MQKKHFLIVAVGLLISLLVLANLPFGRQWLTAQTAPAQHITPSLPASDCDPSKHICDYALPDGSKLRLDIQPKPIKPLQTMRVEVQIEQNDLQQNRIEHVSLDLVGTNMDMGFNQTKLTNLSKGRFAAEASIPVCTTGKMQWQLTLTLEGSNRVSIPFFFETGH